MRPGNFQCPFGTIRGFADVAKGTWQNFWQMVNWVKLPNENPAASGDNVCGLSAAVDSAFAQTWTQATNAPNAQWYSIASSADGARLAAAGGSTGSIYTSTNSGASWTQANAPNNFWYPIASSADGTKLVAGTFGGNIYSSTNSGMNWSSNATPSQLRYSMASSADGTKLVAASTGGQIFISTDSGINWMLSSAPNDYWISVASSADGSKLAAAWI